MRPFVSFSEFLRSLASGLRFGFVIVAALMIVSSVPLAAADNCSTGSLPEGNGGDLTVTTGTCTVHPGTYKYHNVNIYGGGTLLFADEPGGTDFWAESILVENNGSLIAGTAGMPFGTNQGRLRIHLWGDDQGLNGQGITCQSSATCGVPQKLWDSNPMTGMNPASCMRAKDVAGYNQNLPGNVDDCFYAYMPITYDGGGSTPGYFGYKVLAVSYNGTLQLFGSKGSVGDPQPSYSSGTSWAHLNADLVPGVATLTVDRQVDWKMGDQIVVTTTDYVASHSEVFTITGVGMDGKTITFQRVNPACPLNAKAGACFYHFGNTYDMSSTPSGIGPDKDPSVTCSGQQTRCIDTRAVVGLLSRSISIVSGGKTLLSDFPAVNNCGAPPLQPCYYFGGHTIIRQGFQSVQIRGVEFYQLGQGGRIMHYPVHFHMTRKTPQPTSPTGPPVTFVEDSSIWDSMTRWVVLHASQGITIARNVGYLSVGHGFYLEDATETDNRFYSNVGVLARAAVINPQNARQVPGILGAGYPDPAAPPDSRHPQEAVPFHSDIDHPTVFWITNGWNDFQYNKAIGAGTCGTCYWLVPASNSGMSRYEKWWSYASEQQWLPDSENAFERSALTPLRNFVGNSCSTAENSFNTIGDTGPCLGVVRQINQALPRMLPVTQGELAPDPYSQPDQSDSYYPKVDLGGGRFATQCPSGDYSDCSTVARCDSAHETSCLPTAIDHYTDSFNWTETNFSAIWLRPQWYLFSNSATTDVQNGGLTFVTGGGYTESDAIKGHWAIARNDVFVGNTQKNNPYASNSGPFNPATLLLDPTFVCARQASGATAGNYCLNIANGIIMPISNFAANQRLFNIYDGPAYEENNAYLDVTQTKITDCPPSGGNCTNSKWMYGQVFGMPKDSKGQCYLPNAAIGWKQPNGFFYPPAFHSNNLFFNNVDIRHFVIEPLLLAGTYNTDDSKVMERYCTYIPSNPEGQFGLFTGFTDIDRQTELNDDDGSLTGLVNTISVNKDQFFAAPVEDVECRSDVATNSPPVCDKNSETCGTARTSPYDYVTTVVYPDCNENCPQLGKDDPDFRHWWAKDCTNPRCIGVPLYREDVNPDEKMNGAKPYIRMAGQAIAQRSTLTVNHGSYYMDTTISETNQRKWDQLSNQSLVNVFMGGHTYYTFLLFAKPKPDAPSGPPFTKQTYSMYVGPGFNLSSDVWAVQADISNLPIDFSKVSTWPYAAQPTYTDGILTVTIDTSFDKFKTQYEAVAKDHCQPSPNFCTWDDENKSCGCALSSNDKLFGQCKAVCGTWTQKDVDCPMGGCYGIAVKFPDAYVPNGQVAPPAPNCYPNNTDWNTAFTGASQSKAGACHYNMVPTGTFCSTAMIDASLPQ